VKVAKNRLAKIALEGTDAAVVIPLLTGPTVIAYSSDPVAAPKVANDFAKANEKFVILGGAMGKTALDAAAEIHSDIARGFIRCEVLRLEELVAAGSRAEAARRGQQRLEGKTYVVEDGDVLNIRFNV